MMKKKAVKISGYHAHVYYNASSRAAAERVREGLGARFRVRLGRWHDKPVGPHTKGRENIHLYDKTARLGKLFSRDLR